jgi:hypothetical protein
LSFFLLFLFVYPPHPFFLLTFCTYASTHPHYKYPPPSPGILLTLSIYIYIYIYIYILSSPYLLPYNFTALESLIAILSTRIQIHLFFPAASASSATDFVYTHTPFVTFTRSSLEQIFLTS